MGLLEQIINISTKSTDFDHKDKMGKVINAAMALAIIAVWLLAAAHFDAEREVGDQRHATTASPQAQQRKAAAAQRICGSGTTPLWINDSTLTCPRNGLGQARVYVLAAKGPTQ